MAIAETAKLVSQLELDTRKFDSGISKASKGLNTLSTRTVAAGTAIGVGLERIAEKGLSALGGAIGEGIQGVLTLEKAQAQTQAVITSTGGAAKVSAQQVRDLANATEDLTTVDDKTVQQAENLLLTFTNIGGNIFPAATKAATDMAIAFNKGDASTADLDSAAIQLGKALNDPAAGFTALKRAGVSFNDAQIKILKGTNALTKEQNKHYQALLKTDKGAAKRYADGIKAANLLKSQKLILAELNKEFGKAGTAAGTGFAADISRANDAIDDAKIALAQGLIPAVGEVAKVLSSTFRDEKVLAGIRGIGVTLGEAIKNVVAFVRGVDWSKVGEGIKGVFSSLAGIVGAIKSGWDAIPDPLKQLLITGIVADRTMKFLFGFSPASFVISGVEGAVSATIGKAVGAAVIGAGLGKAFVQPVFVTNPGFGAGGGGLPNVLPAAGGAAAGAAGITVAAVAALILAPVAIAAAALLITKITDPTGERNTGGKAATASARGVPAWNNKALGELNAIRGNTRDTAAEVESMRGAIIKGIDGLPAKTAAQATAIQKTAAQHDAETSASIAQLVALDAKTSDIEALRGSISTDLTTASSTMSVAAYQAGQAAASASSMAGGQVTGATWGAAGSIEATIRANRPITNVEVNVSATTVQKTVDVITRYGPSGGDRTMGGDKWGDNG